VMYQIANQPEVLVSEHRSELPDYVVTSLQRAMAKSPTERFDTVREFVGALCNDTAFHATDTLPQVPAFDAGEGAAPPEDATPDQTIAQAEANEDKAPAVFRQQAIWGVLAALMIFGYVAYSHNSGNEDEPETTVTQNEKRAKTPARTKPRKPAAKESAQASPESAIVNVKPKERAEPAHEPRRTAEATEEASANPPLAGSPTGKTQRPPTRSNLPTDEAGSPPAEVKSVKPAATSQRKQPKHRPSGKRTPRPEESKPDASAKSVEVRAKLKLALAALNRGDLVNAERLTTQSTFIKKTATARSYYARIACRKRNWSLAKSYIKRLPKKLRTSTLNRCKKRGFPLVD